MRHWLRYATITVFPLMTMTGIHLGGSLTWFVPALSFVILPILEMLAPDDHANLSAAEEKRTIQTAGFRILPRVVVALQLVVIIDLLWVVRTNTLTGWTLGGAVFSVGICCGVIGINLGHELGHRRKPIDRFLAKLSLLTSLYTHFFIEHNRGHHVRVATDADPASARRNETVYTFWIRSVFGGYRSAWELENQRLRRAGRPVLSIRNEMLRLQLGQLVVLAAVWLTLGAAPTLAWLGAAGIGILLLETVNYFEHYGLRRAPNNRGGFEKVMETHSWNSDGIIGRTFLFELPRHSDHHAHPTRSYATLRSHQNCPQLPAGYPVMILLSLIPPLFFSIMHTRLDGLTLGANASPG